MRIFYSVFAVCLSWIFAGSLFGDIEQGVLRLRFLDSQTGYAVQPDVLISGTEGGNALPVAVDATGRAEIELPFGDYTVNITSDEYQHVAAAVAINSGTPPLQFTLDPVSKPPRLQPDAILPLRKSNATVFIGYVVGEESGRPLANVRVHSTPTGVESVSDEQGFFQLAVPLQSDEEWKHSPATLAFTKEGFQSQEHRSLELWSNGDWILRVRMNSGTGTNVLDQAGKRISPSPIPAPDKTLASNKEAPIAYAVAPTNATLRIPTNIRVLLTNGTVDYISMETYTARSLSQEWFVSWGNYSGGINSLKAGAVAVRSYAASYVNAASGSSTYDICSTTSCQVYRQTSSSNGDTAAAQTTGYVIVGSNNAISRSEYSAENNSQGFSCGDGFTQPTGGCISDPVCAGETRFGHGRGMCQWGTAKWATGLKMAGNGMGNYPANADSGLTNGYPKQDWLWIVDHYFPDLTLVRCTPLMIGDGVIITGSTSRTNHMCADGGISSGTACAVSNFVKVAGSTGLIFDGPVRVTSDGKGFTWWKVVWSDNKVGWIPENWLERIPFAPANLRASAVSTNQISLTWNADSSVKLGYKIERSVNTINNWTQIDDVGEGSTSYSDFNVFSATTNYYRIRAYNLGGNSPYSNTTNAVVPDAGRPILVAIPNRSITEQSTLTFTNAASAPDILTPITDFEIYASGDAVLFRAPSFSGSTSAHIETNAVSSLVTSTFPANAAAGSRVLRANWSFKTGTADPWLRLTTGSAPTLPNPVIDLTKKLRFDIYTDKSLKIGLGARETTNAVGTPIGSNGGSTGSIEFVGVNAARPRPDPVRTIAANSWSTVTFNVPAESIVSFFNGNSTLSTASGLGVFENLALVPNGGLGEYNVYLDNFAVARAKTLTYSLDPGAPVGASVHPITGVFTWTPSEGQGPGNYSITVRVTDDQASPQSDSQTFTITVGETNSPPILNPVLNRIVHAGNSVVITNTASDSDLPINSLAFTLDPGAPMGAAINSGSGVFSWMPGDPFIGSTNTITVRVADNGSPQLSATTSFNIAVIARPAFQSFIATGGDLNLTWSSILGRSYKVQYKTLLQDPNWTDLVTVVASSSTASYSQLVGNGQRFYRIVALD